MAPAPPKQTSDMDHLTPFMTLIPSIVSPGCEPADIWRSVADGRLLATNASTLIRETLNFPGADLSRRALLALRAGILTLGRLVQPIPQRRNRAWSVKTESFC